MFIKRFFKHFTQRLQFAFKKSFIRSSEISPLARINRNNYISFSKISKGSIIESNCMIHEAIINDYVRISKNCSISSCTIDSYSYISQDSWFSETDIGKFCAIGGRVTCGRGNHPTNLISNHPIFYASRNQCGISFSANDHFKERERITIKNDVWIGDNVFIKDGVCIGNGAIIAAGSVIISDIPDYAVVGGVPAKIIRYKFEEDIIKELLELKWWNWDPSDLKKNQSHFIKSNKRDAIALLKIHHL